MAQATLSSERGLTLMELSYRMRGSLWRIGEAIRAAGRGDDQGVMREFGRLATKVDAACALADRFLENRIAGQQWDLLFEKKLDVASFKTLVLNTVKFLHDTPRETRVINGYLVEIMMAQDFQDLTGQVIKKVIAVTQDMEKELLSLLIENAPAGVKAEMHSGLLNGPVVKSDGRNDVVTSQDQVDDLLESLGF